MGKLIKGNSKRAGQVIVRIGRFIDHHRQVIFKQ